MTNKRFLENVVILLMNWSFSLSVVLDAECDWVWSSLAEWLLCSTNSGVGDTTRTRTCDSTSKSDCESFTELRIETTECIIKECDLNWSTWSE